jgi:hypothetical protein
MPEGWHATSFTDITATVKKIVSPDLNAYLTDAMYTEDI